MTQLLKDITIRRMIQCTLLAISALVMGLSAISVNGLRSAGEALATSGDLLHEVSALSRVNDQIMRARLRLSRQLEYAAEGQAAKAAEEGRSIDSALAEARKHQAVFVELALKDAPDTILQPMQTGFDALVNGGIAVQRQHLEAGDIARAREHAATAVVSASRAFGKSMENYEAYAKDRETQLWADAATKRQQAYISMGTVLGICLLLLLLGDRYVVVFVRRPLDQVKAHFQRIAGGDLTAPIPLYGGNCVGQLIPYMQEMQTSLVHTVHAVREGVVEINAGSSEIAAGNQDLSSRTEQQAASLEETAASMEQLLSTVTSNAENARQANQMAATASQVVQRGGMAVQEAVSTMREIAQDSGRIEDIVGVIDGIAFQTNILALNAAVEAARAGEEGKGFAVVAAEVRSLAQRSAGAAKEIKQLLSASSATVQAGSAQVEAAGRTMQEILETIERLTLLVNDIATASQEQVTGIDQVNTAVNQMDQVTQQNAALVEEAAAAASSLETQAQRLQGAVSAFRLPTLIQDQRQMAIAA
ncbi:Aspartate chemoreceptor protein [Achromobacter spanius]|uniref:methyl-accepting chemotaxis protein n=1 Tax=Achromobacter spanius TaxID=217203 RepID=UPI000C2C6775|nr:methyl-accepting chemotaxis protein [Achromobacter spanius]AUA55347.1 methyl-accepting chemotaxis protein [Achromobacter spanius]CAB3679316.1 Methyl-accepting chemotaxis protein II [Achromobacter spanius]VEE57190.1 Aspartate chemoreceptor protein [Achromobacter spanius]